MNHPRECSLRIAPRAFAALLTVLSLTSCTTGFIYNRLDRMVYWYLSRQVTLSDAQGETVREDLRHLLYWHRSYELPRYAEMLEVLARDATHPIGRERIDASRREVEGLWRDIVKRASPHAAYWLGDLSDAQVDELLTNLAQDDEELYEKYCEPDERTLARRRERSIVSTIEDWTGRLSRDQRVIVAAAAAELEPTGCEWVANQRLFRRDFRVLLATRNREPAFGDALTRFLLSPEQRWSEPYRRRFVANRERMVTLLAEIDATLSPRQRARLVSRFSGLARDLRDLSQGRARNKTLTVP